MKASTLPGHKLQYYRATVAYDGTDFRGFQLQAATGGGPVRTVQGVLEEALLGLTGANTRVVGSGRTDTGVHASGQVVGFHASWRHADADLQRALNAVLPPDIAVTTLVPAADGWHPRFSARWRHYRYTVVNRQWRDPLTRRYALHLSQPLDIDRLQATTSLVIGEHDFATFGRPMTGGEPGEPGTSTVRAIFAAEWRERAGRFTFDVIGNAFLRSMVRSLAGSMLQVGLGEWPVEQLAAALAGRDRSLAARPAAACGLCLMHVEYEGAPATLPNEVLAWGDPIVPTHEEFEQ